MANITKNRQNKEQLHSIVQKAFGGSEVLIDFKELPDGFCNATYELELSDGRQVILKIAPEEGVQMMSCEVEMMATEVMAMQLAKEHQIPGVAEVYAYDNSKEICSGDYFIMEKLEGQGYHIAKQDMTEEQKFLIDYMVGERLHQVHQIEGAKFGHLCKEELQYEEWFEAFYSMIKKMIDDGIRAGVEVGVAYEDIAELLCAHKENFLEVTKPSLTHFDSWDGNIFVNDEKVVGFIDWERALWAEGLMEDRFRTHSVTEGFKEGYGLTSLSESQQIRSLWYDVYLYLIMMMEGTYRHYETDEQYHWVKSVFMPVWEQLKNL